MLIARMLISVLISMIAVLISVTPAPFMPSLSALQAQAVTLTVAQAFKIAFEFWQAAKEGESTALPGLRPGFGVFPEPSPPASQISRFLLAAW